MKNRNTQRAVVIAGVAVALAAVPLSARAQEVSRLPVADRPLALRPTELYRVGKAEGAEWETFANVQTVAFDAQDNLYILDTGNFRIHVFDAAGRHVHSFGRRGEGPGELGMPMGLTIAANGEILVADVMRPTLQRFARDGTPLPSLDPGSHRITGRTQAHPQGGYVGQATSMEGDRIEGRPQPRARELRWWRGSGEPQLLVTAPPQPTAQIGGQQLVVNMPLAFAPMLHWGVLPDGSVAVNSGEEYRVEIIAGNGRVTRVIERAIPPRRVTERDKETFRTSRRPRMVFTGGGGNAPSEAAVAQLEASLQNMEFHDRIQVIRQFAVDPFGRLWIMRNEDAAVVPGPIDLVAADGSYMGTLPAQPLPNAFSGTGRIAYIERDEDDIPYVVVKQVPHARS